MSSAQLDDGRVGSRIENYSGFWQKDTSKEAQVDSDTRVENYTEVVNGAVSLNTLYPVGHRLIYSPV